MMAADELISRWYERDVRYTRRRQPLSDAEANAIVAWRFAEAQALSDPTSRSVARDALRSWRPPEARLR